MNTSKVKALAVVFTLLLATGFIAAGCKGKAQSGWVNTGSLPGHSFKQNVKHEPVKNPRIVYLGSSSETKANFGPGEVRFDLENLR